MLRRSSLVFLAICPVLVLCALFSQARAQSAAGSMYEATVPLTANTERGRAEAFAEAMRQVLAQATGRTGAADEPELAPLVKDAARYVQLYRPAPGGMLFVGFNARRIDALVGAADPSQMQSVLVTVGGIATVQQYAEVSGALEALAQVRRLEVVAFGGDTVNYRASVRGDAQQLAQAIAGIARLQADVPDAAAAGGALRFRYQP